MKSDEKPSAMYSEVKTYGKESDVDDLVSKTSVELGKSTVTNPKENISEEQYETSTADESKGQKSAVDNKLDKKSEGPNNSDIMSEGILVLDKKSVGDSILNEKYKEGSVMDKIPEKELIDKDNEKKCGLKKADETVIVSQKFKRK